MCRFIESIQVVNAIPKHLFWHQMRINKTFDKFFPEKQKPDLELLITQFQLTDGGQQKLRIVYDDSNLDWEILAYYPKKIETIEWVECNFEYAHKFENRTDITNVLNSTQADEVIFTKNGKILDSSYSNLAFLYDNQWFTPNTYLLNGTTRQRLLSTGQIKETEISLEDLTQFSKISFINALNDLGTNVINI
ncbi:MAG: aminotransferase class IV [Flavobacteriaceae bacterium]|nr:aminotransferase class IV [Flavobacteriaceae bacterium]